jgi:hypothetical protein
MRNEIEFKREISKRYGRDAGNVSGASTYPVRNP